LGGSNEYLGMLGFWATIISFGQSFLSEQDEVKAFFAQHDGAYCSKSEAWILLFVYIISNTLYYHGVARFLQISDAAFVSRSCRGFVDDGSLVDDRTFFISLFLLPVQLELVNRLCMVGPFWSLVFGSRS
jgi:hypothetical protein